MLPEQHYATTKKFIQPRKGCRKRVGMTNTYNARLTASDWVEYAGGYLQ